MEYELDIKEEPLEFLRKQDDDVRRSIGLRLRSLQKDFSGDVKKLKGSRNEYRLRVGN